MTEKGSRTSDEGELLALTKGNDDSQKTNEPEKRNEREKTYEPEHEQPANGQVTEEVLLT